MATVTNQDTCEKDLHFFLFTICIDHNSLKVQFLDINCFDVALKKYHKTVSVASNSGFWS